MTLHAVRRQPTYAERFLFRSVDPWLHSNTLPRGMWDIDHLLPASVLRFRRARNRQGFDIYLLPYAEPGNAGYILLDLDHPMVDVVPQMPAHGHEPCVVLQTSRGLLHAWIRVSITPLEPAVATSISRQLAHTNGGDWCDLERWLALQKSQAATSYCLWFSALGEDRPRSPPLASAAQDLLRSVSRLSLARAVLPSVTWVMAGRAVFAWLIPLRLVRQNGAAAALPHLWIYERSPGKLEG